MSDCLADPPRWKDHRDQANLAERAAGCGFRSLDPPKPLGPEQVARIADRICTEPVKRFPWRLCFATTTALLLGAATAASAARLHLLPRWLTGQPEPIAQQEQATKPRGAKPAQVTAPPREEPFVQSLPEDPAATQPASAAPEPSRQAERVPRNDISERKALPAAKTRPAPNAKRTELPALEFPSSSPTAPAFPPAPSPAPGPLAPVPIRRPLPPAPLPPVAWTGGGPARSAADAPRRQVSDRPVLPDLGNDVAQHLAEAIRQLRVEHAPRTALATLARHETQLGQHGLAHEVLLIRVEALLELHREQEVLLLLDRSSLTDVAAQKSLLLTRGELRAAAGRCAEATGDFDLVLARSNPPDQRALRGQAACRGKRGEQR